LQKQLAKEVTCFVHSRHDYEFAVNASEILFGNATTETLKSLNEKQLLQVMEGVPAFEYPKASLSNGVDVITFLADTKIFPSKGEARKTIQGGGVSINKEKVSMVDLNIDNSHLLNEKYILVQKGKKNYFLVKTV
jgi:tyrosyl-tRNA synthetase